MNGSLSTVGLNENILTGGLVKALNPVWDSNVGYFPVSSGSVNGDAGYYAGWMGGTVVNNWIMGGSLLSFTNASPAMSGNHLSKATVSGSGKHQTTSCPAGSTCGIPPLTILVRPDQYEPGRALATVINLASNPLNSVNVPVAALGYANGEWVTVATAEDYFGVHRSFRVVNGSIALPLTGWTIAAPIGWTTPRSTLPAFGAFILRRTF
jgi:hypothetical protein